MAAKPAKFLSQTRINLSTTFVIHFSATIIFTSVFSAMKKIAIISLCTLGHILSFCQSEGPFGGGASLVSLARMTAVVPGVESLYNNHTQLLRLRNGWGVDASAERRFGLSELSTISLGGFIKRENDCFGLSISRFGFTSYFEQEISISYARKMLDNFYLGAKINHTSYNTDKFGSTSILTTDFGLTTSISSTVWMGGFIKNPFNFKVSAYNTLPAVIAAGVQYLAGKKVSILLEAEKIIDRNVILRFGLIYDISEQLEMRLGTDLTRSVVGLGFGFRFHRYTKVRGAFSMHNVLGVTPALSFQYQQIK